MSNYLGINEAAKLLNVEQKFVRKRVLNGTIKAFRVGNRIKIATEAIQEFLQQNKIRAKAKPRSEDSSLPHTS